MVFKIDFEKDYNCVDWDFLWFVLIKMGFGEKWIRWVKRCVRCARISVLVNKSLGSEFKKERSLKQGYPL